MQHFDSESSVDWLEEYDEERLSFLRKQEIARPVGPSDLAGAGKPGLITPKQRTRLVDWVAKVHAAIPAASLQSLFLAINVFDRFLYTAEAGRVPAMGGGWEFLCLACLGLASKYEDTQPPSLRSLATLVSSGGDQDVRSAQKSIVAMEQLVVSALGYHLTVPTALSFLGEFTHRASLVGFLSEGLSSKDVREEAEKILLRVLRDSSSLSHLPSALAASAFFWATSISTPDCVRPSSSVFKEVTQYDPRKLRRCFECIRTTNAEDSASGVGQRDGNVQTASVHATSRSIPAAAVAPRRLIDAHEYDEDRMSFLRKQEIARPVGPGDLAGAGKPGLITPKQRTKLVDWVAKVHAAIPAASLQSLFLAINVFDRFLYTAEAGRVPAMRGGWKFLCLACLGLALKYEDTQPPSLRSLATLVSSGGDQGVRSAQKSIVAMEQLVVSSLGYHLTVPTALSFLGEFTHRASLVGFLPEGLSSKGVREEAEKILLRVLRDSSSLSHLPSVLAASAMYLASFKGMRPSPFVFCKVTKYHLSKLRRCVKFIRAMEAEGSASGVGRRCDVVITRHRLEMTGIPKPKITCVVTWRDGQKG